MNIIINNIRNKIQQKNDYTDEELMDEKCMVNEISKYINKEMIDYDTLFEMANEIPMYLYNSELSDTSKIILVTNKINNQLNIKNFFAENILSKIKNIFDSLTYNIIIKNFSFNFKSQHVILLE